MSNLKHSGKALAELVDEAYDTGVIKFPIATAKMAKVMFKKDGYKDWARDSALCSRTADKANVFLKKWHNV